MKQDRQLRGFLIAMLVGAGLMVLGQLMAWRHSRRRHGRDERP